MSLKMFQLSEEKRDDLQLTEKITISPLKWNQFMMLSIHIM